MRLLLCIIGMIFCTSVCRAEDWNLELALGVGTSKVTVYEDILSSLSWNPTSKDFGNQNVATNTDQVFTLTGSEAEEISLAVTGTGYSLLSTTCGNNPFDLLTGTCTATVRFTPASAGTLTGSLVASWTNQSDKTVSLTGVGVGQVETTLASQLTDAVFWTMNNLSTSDNAQKIKNTSQCTITKVRLKLGYTAGTGTVTVSVWDGNDRATANQIGGNSNAVVLTYNTNAPSGFTEFTWSSNAPQPTGDYFIHVNQTGSYTFVSRAAANATPTAYEDTNYDFVRDQSDKDADLVFEILGTRP